MTYYSPVYPRGREAAVFSAGVPRQFGAVAPFSVAIAVEHKNRDETTWGVAGTFPSFSGVSVASTDVTGVKEEYRFALTVTGGSADELVHVVLPAPAWRPF